jgi:hypothetical protein
MEWDEAIRDAFGRFTQKLKKGLKDLIVADDRPEGWYVGIKVAGEKHWRTPNGQTTRAARQDSED